MDHLILGFSGRARSGKDTLFNLLQSQFSSRFDVRRFSVGDIIRQHLNMLPYITDKDINFFDLKSDQKELWRPLMVAYGNSCRNFSKGRFFIDILEPHIKSLCLNKPTISCITDIRFDEFDKDEVYWLQNEINGKLIYIDRYTTDLDGNESTIPFVNDTERDQDPKLRKKADLLIHWPTVNDKQILLNYAKPLFDRIKQDWLPV
jgi:hypothetical protein